MDRESSPDGHDRASPTAGQSTPWLTGHQPAPGRIARAAIQSAADIPAIEAADPNSVLPGPTLYECIRAAAQLDPNKLAIVHLLSVDGAIPPQTLTYGELLDQLERAASLFRALAGAERAAVGIILPMLPEALIAAWAASTAGIAIPINPFLEIGHVVALLNSSRATVLVVGCERHGRGVWDKLPELIERVPTLCQVLVVGGEDPGKDFSRVLSAQPPGLSFVPVRDAHAVATHLATGGTTAAPKLVRMTHQGQLLMAWLIGAHSGSVADDVIGHAMPNFHVGGANLLTLRAVLYGQTLITFTTDGFRNPQIVNRFWDVLRAHRVTTVIATPATAAAILAQPAGDATGNRLKVFNCGGSTIPVDVLNGFYKRFGVWLREVWGMSEFHGNTTIHPDLAVSPVVGSVGRAAPWHRIKVVELDSANRLVRECLPGERGTLIARGPALMPGYVDSRFDAEFFVTGMPGTQRWANTGDVGTMDADGYVWIFGRAKDVIIRGGHNIDPRMIEEVLVRHPAVQIAAAIGRPDAEKGELPIAYVQLKKDALATAEELLSLCRAQVQERAAIPIEILVITSIPMTAVGKINKPALRSETLIRVATRQAQEAAGAHARIEVQLDEAGVRPRVRIDIRSETNDHAQLRDRLEKVFRSYEFETVLTIAS
jgi:fatty-acyl-CoA synthase